MSAKKGQKTTKRKAELHGIAMPLLEAMYTEFKELCRKKPDGTLSKSKIQVVNRLLEACRQILESEASLQYLDLLDEDSMPQNSDVVLMLSQYEVAMKQFRSSYYGKTGPGFDAEYAWLTSD